MKYANRILGRASRVLILSTVYSCLFSISLLLAFEFRDNFSINDSTRYIVLNGLPAVLAIKLASMLVFGQFRGLLTFFRLPDLYRLSTAMGIPAVIMIMTAFALNEEGILFSKAALVLDFFFSVSLLCLFRTILRIYRERNSGYEVLDATVTQENVIIYGAGNTGSALSAHLLGKRGKVMNPVAFIDDDESKWDKYIHGIRVWSSTSDLGKIKNRYKAARIVVAMPSASPTKIREITQQASHFKLTVEIVPSWDELVSGRKRVDKIRPVKIEDLLGRNAINLHSDKVLDMVKNKVVLVTGAGGTIGCELCRQVAQCGPSLLIMVERAEYLLFQTEQLIKAEFPEVASHAFMGDVTDEARMDFLMGGFLPNIIFHAAAHKHVPMMEHQPGEAVRNNTLGTANLADLAIKHEVERFVLISSDKAVNPTNVMGVTKRMAEIFIQSLQENSSHTQFMAVRFGNVLGSSGSVIPTFKKQIEEGGPVTVTHPDITRYFMTVGEAVGLVLDCSSDANGGEIFVLDMGEPVKVYDLAKQMIELSGLQVGVDIDIVFSGLRPGEKLYEELQHGEETLELTHKDKVFRFKGAKAKEESVRKFLNSLVPFLKTAEYNEIKRRIQNFVPEYKPDFSAPKWAEEHEEVAETYRKEGILEKDDKIVLFKKKTA
ncbi:polysaccharide biosynthesis protein [Puniceicoccaceae bacterium K14]|nr:polysaccharide biosynthesis protein [Puniceicoccaceae bacterium K14]